MVFGGYRSLTVCKTGVRDGVLCARPSTEEPRHDRRAYVNRELSWLEFNRRVLEEAQDPSVPAPRAREVPRHLQLEPRRVLHGARGGAQAPRARGRHDGGARRARRPSETLAALSARVHELVEEQHRCFLDEVEPLLAAEGVTIVRPKDIDDAQRDFLEQYVRRGSCPC